MLLKFNPKLTSPLSTWKHSLKILYSIRFFFCPVFFKRAQSTKAWADPLAEAEKRGIGTHIRRCGKRHTWVFAWQRMRHRHIPPFHRMLAARNALTDRYFASSGGKGVISTSRVDAVGARTFVLMIRFRTHRCGSCLLCHLLWSEDVCRWRGGGDFSLAPPFHC